MVELTMNSSYCSRVSKPDSNSLKFHHNLSNPTFIADKASMNSIAGSSSNSRAKLAFPTNLHTLRSASVYLGGSIDNHKCVASEKFGGATWLHN